MNTVVDIVRSWAASDSSVNPTKEILEWVEQRNATVKVRIDKTDFEKDGFWYYNEEEGCICNRNHSFFSVCGYQRIEEGKVIIEQPIIIQNEIGYLGILCKKIDGVLHFLMQAKIEISIKYRYPLLFRRQRAILHKNTEEPSHHI